MGERVCIITEDGIICGGEHYAKGLCSKHYMREHRGYSATENRSRGGGHCRAKLTETDVLEMRRLWTASDLTREQLGEIFGVKASTVGNVVTRRTWTHI